MANKFWTVVNFVVLIFVVLFGVNLFWNFSNEDSPNDVYQVSNKKNCIDVKKVSGFEYDACYDAYSKMIFLKVKRKNEDYNISSLKISFIDFVSRSYDLKDVPGAGESRAYKLESDKNPQNIDVSLDVVRDFVESVCGTSERVFVEYCPTGIGRGNDSGVSVSPLEGVGIEDFVEVDDVSDLDSDIFTSELIDDSKVWDFKCESRWDCEDWETCIDGVQHRDCVDVSRCAVSRDFPKTVQRCDGGCVEDWECEWSACEDGYSVPSCKDLNNCGTKFDIPKKLFCEGDRGCVSKIECGEWSECEVDYNFLDLVGSDIADLRGTKSRVCKDLRRCIPSQKEVRACSVSVDIYTSKFKKCGEEYIGVYNVFNDELLAVVREGTKKSPFLNIYFDKENEFECDYCFDGIMDGDEVGVDCGGSCRDCVESVNYSKKHWWNFLF